MLVLFCETLKMNLSFKFKKREKWLEFKMSDDLRLGELAWPGKRTSDGKLEPKNKPDRSALCDFPSFSHTQKTVCLDVLS